MGEVIIVVGFFLLLWRAVEPVSDIPPILRETQSRYAQRGRAFATWGVLAVAALLLLLLVVAVGTASRGAPGTGGAIIIGLLAFPLAAGVVSWRADHGGLLFLTAYPLAGAALDSTLHGGEIVSGFALLVGVPLALGAAGALEALQRHPWEALFTSVGLTGIGVVVVSGAPEALAPVAAFVAVGLVLIGGAVYRGRATRSG